MEIELLHNPPNERDIKELWGFFSVDPGGLGLIGVQTQLGFTPLVTGNPRLVERMRAQAQSVGQQAGKEIRLYHFVRDADPIWSTAT